MNGPKTDTNEIVVDNYLPNDEESTTTQDRHFHRSYMTKFECTEKEER